MPATTEKPCAQCGSPHKYSQRDGWYSTNNGHPRHPYTPKSEDGEMRVTIGNKPDTAGFHTALFGGLFACDHCGAVVDHPDVPLHRGACHPKDAA